MPLPISTAHVIHRFRPAFALLAIAVAFPVRAQQADSAHGASPEPYSRLTVRVGATRAQTFNPLSTYYPGNSGAALEIETPFEFGLLGIVVEAITFKGTTPQQITTSTNTFALDWRGRVPLTDRVALRPGVRVGDFHMVFQDPAFNLPGASPDHGTEEFLIGPTAALDLRLAGPLQATLAGAWIYIPTATRTKIAYVTLLGSYTVGTPPWLKRFLQ